MVSEHSKVVRGAAHSPDGPNAPDENGSFTNEKTSRRAMMKAKLGQLLRISASPRDADDDSVVYPDGPSESQARRVVYKQWVAW